MNYLARRIDSSDNYELAKFQGAIARDNIYTAKEEWKMKKYKPR